MQIKDISQLIIFISHFNRKINQHDILDTRTNFVKFDPYMLQSNLQLKFLEKGRFGNHSYFGVIIVIIIACNKHYSILFIGECV